MFCEVCCAVNKEDLGGGFVFYMLGSSGCGSRDDPVSINPIAARTVKSKKEASASVLILLLRREGPMHVKGRRGLKPDAECA